MTIKKINKGKDGKVTSIDAVTDLDNKDFKKTLKVTWLAETPDAPFIPTKCLYYDHIISKAVLDKADDFKSFINKDTETEIDMIGDHEFKKLAKGDIIQIQRRGYFIVDSEYKAPTPHTGKPKPIVLIAIPDGTPTSYGPPKAINAIAGAKPTSAPASTPNKGGKKEKSPPAAATPTSKAPSTGVSGKDLNDKITAQGDKVRNLKSPKGRKGRH